MKLGGGTALAETLTCGATIGSFGTQVTGLGGNCISFNSYNFNAGGGFRYSNSNFISNSYTINVCFKFNAFSPTNYGSIINFSNLTSDCAIYLSLQNLSFWCSGMATIGAAVFSPNCFNFLSFVRNGSTGLVTIYLNGAFFASFTDSGNTFMPTTSNTPIYFFNDNTSGGPTCNSWPGSLAYISLSPNIATAIDITSTWSNVQTLLQSSNASTAFTTITPSNPILNCANSSITLTASGGGTYNWGGGITTATKTVSSSGTYSVTVVGTNCCTASASSVVSQNITPPSASITSATAVLNCATPSITLTASGGGTYAWSGGGATATKIVSTAGTYTVTVTGANGCTATASTIITQNSTPPVAAVSSPTTILTCATPSITVTASGGGTYNWGGGVTTAANTVNAANTYTVTVTGANGCTATASAIVSQNVTPPAASVSPANATLTCGAPSTTLTASGGVSYDWGGGITTAANTVNAANTYSVTVTGANGCTATASSVVSQNFTPPAAAISPSSFTLTCASPSTTLTASGSGTYNWGGGITTAANTVNAANTYTVTVTDGNGCTASASSVVTIDNAPPAASVSPASPSLTCTALSVTLTASGGGTYNWGGGITTATNTVNAANTYTVTVTGANGCTSTASSVVTQNITPPVASVTPASASLTCANPSATLTASGGGTYNWGGGVTTGTNSVNTPNTYTVTVTGANGCTATASSTVTQSNAPPAVSISPTSATLSCTTGSVTLTASGVGTYDWGSGITTAANTVSAANTYTVTVTDGNGCTATASAVVSQDITAPVAAVNPSSSILTCTTPSVALSATGGGTYNWGGGITTATNTVSTPNSYTVTVTGANGCTATASSTITQNITLPVAGISPANATLTCANNSITLTASGGGTYDWGGGVTTSINTISTPNTYTVTVTAANGCTATASSVVSQSITIPAASVTPASFTLDCNTPSTVLTAGGGTTYNWGGGIITAANTVNSANTYTVTVTDVNGCTATASSVVIQDIAPPAAAVAPANAALNCITSSVTLTASGGGTYDWGGGITTAANTVNSANTYSVTVTGANGCTASASSVIATDFAPPAATITPANATLTCTTTAITLTAGGGATYDWGGGITTATNTVSTPNTYTVTVTGANGCTATASSVVTQDINPPLAAVSPANITLTCTIVSSALTASGGGTYDWGGGVTTAINTASTPNTYTVTVTAANGCTATASSVVSQSVTVPAASVTPASFTLDCNTPSTVLTAGGGTTYNWGGGIITAANSVNSANTYTVTVTDVNGCTATASSVVIQDIAPPVAAVAPANAALNCITSSVTLTASGGGTYDWGGGITTAANTVNSANTYTVTVTGNNGCTAIASSVIATDFAPPAATITPGNATLTCTTAAITITAGGGATYDWGGGITTAANSVSTPNSYTVTVTGANGCTATASSTITQNIALPVAGISPAGATLTCANSSITLTASGGATYDWGGGVTTATNSVILPNTYTVTVIGSNGCTASASSVVIQDIATPNVSIATGVTLTCAVLNSTLTASSTTANVTYDWGAGITTPAKTVTVPGVYTVTVTDPANGCTATSSGNVAQDIVAPNVSLTNTGIISCINANVTINASSTTANVNYDWGGGNNTTSSSVTVAGNYTITVTNPSNSCTATATNTVQQSITAPPVSIATPAALNCINSTVTLTASSTVSNAAYDWSGGITTATNTVSLPASYPVTVTDPANGCTASASANVIQNLTVPTAIIAPPGIVTCNTPTITLSASSSAVIPVYNWGGGNIGSAYPVTTAGNYAVTVTDNDNGCSASASVTVTDVPLMNLSETHTDATCFSFNDGTIDLSVTGGQAPFTYLWSNTAVTEDINGLIAGNYSVVVTDGINCTIALTVPITEPANISVTENHTDVTCNGFNNGIINVTVSGGLPPYTYRWNDADVNEDRTGLAPGNYTLTVTYNNSCTTSITAPITEPSAISLQPVVTNPTCATQGSNGNISVTATGGTAPYSFVWNDGVTTANYANAGIGNYSLTVTDDNGCTVVDTYVLNYEYDFVVDALPFVTIDLGASTVLTYTLTGNTGNYTGKWTPGYGLDCTDCVSTEASPTYSTLYNITIENEVGCLSSDTVTVRVLPKYDVFVPNVFTPNNDGNNDLFQVFGNLKGVEFLQIQIFNRIGEKVFESYDHQFSWDGTYQGVLQTPQIFTYQLKLTWLNGFKDELRKGTLTLLK